MKTLTYRSLDGSKRVDIKVDLYKRISEIVVPGFDFRFTNMVVETPGANQAARQAARDLATVQGLDLKQIENGYQAAVALALDSNVLANGWGLYVSDPTDTSISGPQKQQVTVALVGTSGTGNVTIGANDYLATFDTDDETTADNFVTTHAAAILSAEGVVVTHNSGGVLELDANVSGVGFAAVVFANVTGDLAGAVVTVATNISAEGEVCIVPPSIS